MHRFVLKAYFLCLLCSGVLFSYLCLCLLVCARVTRIEGSLFEESEDQAYEEYEQQEQGQEGKSCP